MKLSPETVLNERYLVVRAIRQGGMGAVYEARDQRLANTPCALKVLLDHFHGTVDHAAVQRKFDEEMRVLSGLKHPNIPRIRDYFVDGSTCYIVMDFIDGENLEQELQQSLSSTGHAFSDRQLREDLLQVLDVLAYLHSQSPPIIHRDVKPSNLIRERGTRRVMLVDFGLAREIDDESYTPQTSIGTLEYCPLEQLQGAAEPRSDLYALGATAFHLLSGEVPQPLISPNLRARPEVNPALADIVDRATAFEVEHRFPSATAIREAVQRCQARVQESPTDGSSPTAPLNLSPDAIGTSKPQQGGPPVVAARWSRRTRWLVASLVLLALAAGFFRLAPARLWAPVQVSEPPAVTSRGGPDPPRWEPFAPAGWTVKLMRSLVAPPNHTLVDMFRMSGTENPRIFAAIAFFETGGDEAQIRNGMVDIREMTAREMGLEVMFQDGPGDNFTFQGHTANRAAIGATTRTASGEGYARFLKIEPNRYRVFIVLMKADRPQDSQQLRQVLASMIPTEIRP